MFLSCDPRTTNEHVTGERDKLRSDLTEAHNRISLLVKEGDDRHNSMERSKDNEIQSVLLFITTWLFPWLFPWFCCGYEVTCVLFLVHIVSVCDLLLCFTVVLWDRILQFSLCLCFIHDLRTLHRLSPGRLTATKLMCVNCTELTGIQIITMEVCCHTE